MNVHAKNNLKKILLDQINTNSNTLVLNDMLLGQDGANLVAEFIPQFHHNLEHLEIKGSNIDSEGFEVICVALLNCPHIKSIIL
jgi:hypothetical protein